MIQPLLFTYLQPEHPLWAVRVQSDVTTVNCCYRAINLRTQFAELLADDINQGCTHKTRPEDGRARGGVVEVESADPRMAKAHPVERVTAADIERAVRLSASSTHTLDEAYTLSLTLP